MAKASVLKSPKQIDIVDYPVPHEGTLVEMEACGVCGTDPHIFDNNVETDHPIIMGHELLGRLVRIDEDVQAQQKEELIVGDRVFIAPGINCNVCYYCNEVGSLCEDRKFYGLNMRSDEAPSFFGGFAEYLAIRSGTTLYKLSDDLPTEVAVLIEPMACGIRAFKHAFDDIEKAKNSTVAVLGVGPIGLFTSIAAKHYGAKSVITVDRLPHRLDLAKRFGADSTLNRQDGSKDDLIKTIRELTPQKVGADVVINCTGENDSVEYGLPLLRKGGTFVEKGIYADQGEMPFNPSFLCTNNIKIVGTSYTHLSDFEEAIEILTKRELPYEIIVSDKLRIQDTLKAINRVIKRDCMKIIICP